ncbi:MAG: dihydroorotase [Candidatus Kapabacteria bacterium]|nr:dihydroorotase [Candidatus Kapabacteria bacterium]
MNIIFKSIRVVNPEQNLDGIFDLWIKDGFIHSIATSITNEEPETRVIPGKDLVALPGFFDMHVHLREPGFEYKEDIQSGCAAAANGGFTGVCCMPNTNPVIDNVSVVELIRKKAENLPVDVKISAAITQGSQGKQLSPFYELNEAGVVMFTDDGKCVTSSEVMKRAFNYASTKKLLIAQHCEDHSLTENFSVNEGVMSSSLGLKGYPSVAEDIIVKRDILLNEYTGNNPYHISHISTKNSVKFIREAKSRGLNVTCEVTPHHFCLNEEFLSSYDTNYKMNPPLRTKEDIQEILAGLKDGTIDCIASDHAPHALHEKEVEFEKAPYGIVGLETTIGLTFTYLYHTNILTLNDIINKLSTNPRKILNLEPIIIKEGNQANLTIVDIDEEWIVDKNQFKSKSKNTPFNGFKLKGKPKYIINKNQIIESTL